MDYQSNAKKNKEQPKPEKRIEKVVSSEVVIQKKSLGQKFKETFIKDTLSGVLRYVISDIIIPETINMFVDATTKAIGRIAYGESAMRRRTIGTGSRTIYNSPINRGYAGPVRDNLDRTGLPVAIPAARSSRHVQDTFIIATREEAALVLERMNDIIDTYEVVSVLDLNDLLGLETSPLDNKWGWVDLRNVQIQQVREGYLIDLPPAEPIQ